MVPNGLDESGVVTQEPLYFLQIRDFGSGTPVSRRGKRYSIPPSDGLRDDILAREPAAHNLGLESQKQSELRRAWPTRFVGSDGELNKCRVGMRVACSIEMKRFAQPLESQVGQ